MRVPSATDVAPQQREWAIEAIQAASANSVLARVPAEIIMMISDENGETMTRPEAEKYREELMAERTVVLTENNKAYFEHVRSTLHLGLTMELTLSTRSSRNSTCGEFPRISTLSDCPQRCGSQRTLRKSHAVGGEEGESDRSEWSTSHGTYYYRYARAVTDISPPPIYSSDL